MSYNRAILFGNCGRDPETKTLNSGDKVATFSLATSESWKDKNTGERKETTDWHTIVVFNQNLIPVIEQYVKKGTKLSIEGQIKTRKWTANDGSDRYTTEIVIPRFGGHLGLEGQPRGVERDEHGYGSTRDRPSTGSGSRREGAARQDDPRMGMGDPGPSRLADQLDDDIPF